MPEEQLCQYSAEQDELKLHFNLSMPFVEGGNIILILISNILQTKSDTCKCNTCMTNSEEELLLFITQNKAFVLIAFIHFCLPRKEN